MDKLSFASAYRSAAILAAFSGAGAPDEEPARDALPRMAGQHWRPALSRCLREMAQTIAGLRNGWSGRLAGPSEPETEASRRTSPHYVPFAPLVDPTGQRGLVSHFSFCDEVDRRQPGTRL